jgi:hypothetical protein
MLSLLNGENVPSKKVTIYPLPKRVFENLINAEIKVIGVRIFADQSIRNSSCSPSLGKRRTCWRN